MTGKECYEAALALLGETSDSAGYYEKFALYHMNQVLANCRRELCALSLAAGREAIATPPRITALEDELPAPEALARHRGRGQIARARFQRVGQHRGARQNHRLTRCRTLIVQAVVQALAHLLRIGPLTLPPRSGILAHIHRPGHQTSCDLIPAQTRRISAHPASAAAKIASTISHRRGKSASPGAAAGTNTSR